jgi:signal peptidase I
MNDPGGHLWDATSAASGGDAGVAGRPVRRPRRRPPLLDRALLVVIGLVVGLLLHVFVVQTSVVLENSMAPTLTMGDRLLLDKLSPRLRHLRHGDVVVFSAPVDGTLLVKRVVALGGEVVEAREGVLWVNDRPVDEPYAVMTRAYNFPRITVPPGEAFVLGDNRSFSEDSATWRRGIPLSSILGRVVWLYWPYGRSVSA